MSASTLKKSCEIYVNNEDGQALEELVQALKDGKANLLLLVEALNDSLTDPEKHVRCRAIKLLATVMHRLPYDFVTEQEVPVLVTFFCMRLEDHYSIQPHVVSGLLALSRNSTITVNNVHKICRALFMNIQTQTMVATDRLCVYQVFSRFLHHRLSDVLQMELDFVYGYIQVVDGEKDPRNLLIAFDGVAIVAKHFSMGRLAEELFEFVACYFPVDFKPPANDPHKISKDELVLGLRKCLCASPLFAEHCWPMLLEKMTSTLASAKIDSFETVSACSKVYGAKELLEFTGSYWAAMRREVLFSNSEQCSKAALQALRDISKLISQFPSKSSNEELFDFVDMIIKDCDKSIVTPDERITLPVFSMLCCVASASRLSCERVCKAVIPNVVKTFQEHPQVKARQIILDGVCSLIQIVANIADDRKAEILADYKEDFFPFLVSILCEPILDVQHSAIKCVLALYQVPEFLTIQEKENVTQHYLRILQDPQRDDIRNQCISCLQFISQSEPELITREVIPVLHRLLSKATTTETTLPTNIQLSHSDVLEFLGAVCRHFSLIPPITEIILVYMQNAAKAPYNDESEQNTLACCQCLLNIINHNDINSNAVMQQTLSTMLTECIKLSLQGALSEQTCVLNKYGVMCGIAKCVGSIMINATKSMCDSVVNLAHTIFVKLDVSSLGISAPANWDPLHDLTNEKSANLIVIFSAMLSSVPRECSIPDLDMILELCYQMSVECGFQHCSTKAAQLLANLTNKITSEDLVTQATDAYVTKLTSHIADTPTTHSNRAVCVLIYLTKGLLIRSHPSQTMLIDKLIGLLSNSTLGDPVAEGFDVILSTDSRDMLSAEHHCIMRILYHQRFYIITSQRLIQRFHDAHTDTKAHYLTALSHQLKYLAGVADLPPLIPLLIQSLSHGGATLWLSAMRSIQDVMLRDITLLTPHVDDIVSKCSTMAGYKENMKVRMQALKCLACITSLESPRIIIHRRELLYKLKQLRDDPKRLVRNECVKAITAWELLG